MASFGPSNRPKCRGTTAKSLAIDFFKGWTSENWTFLVKKKTNMKCKNVKFPPLFSI